MAAPATSKAADGMLSIDTHPAGVNVYVDGRLVGTTPLLLPQVSAGFHTLRLHLDSHREWSSSVEVTAGARTRVTASLEEADQGAR